MTTVGGPGPNVVGRYQLSSTLGIGGFASVHRAYDSALDADVAIKILQAQFADSADIRNRFLQEARLLRRVDSPNLIKVYDIGELDPEGDQQGRPYFVMELADGGVLGSRVRGGVGRDSIRQVIDALASGLGALHQAGIVHRDIKPDNLLIARSGTPVDTQIGTLINNAILADNERLVIGDLGLAKDRSRTSAGPTVSGGTPLYRAPEQTVRGAEITPAADIYAATGVLWFTLTGENPPETDAVPVQLTSMPAAWQPILERGLQRDPMLRHGSIAEWAVDAAMAIEQSPATGTPTVTGGGVGVGRVGGGGAAADDGGGDDLEVVGLCPYKGMAAYQPEDAGLFFGRDDLIDTLVGRLQHHSVLVIGGPSGSGKSSLMRAGLIPRISRGALAGSKRWRIALFNPGSDAVGELIHQLRRLRPDADDAGGRLTRDDLPQGGRRWLDDGDQDGVPTLLAIDQFEELFTLNPNRADQELFLETLAVMTESEHSRIRVTIALRADFYGVCAGHPWLNDRINESQLLVGPMNKAELRDAITIPAQRAGLHLEKGLADAVLDDVGEGAGALPLLGHALMETWIRRRGSQLTIEGYEAAGGVSGAIAQRAEDVYTQLNDDDRTVARHLLLQLINPGQGTPDTRRRVRREDLRGDENRNETVEPVLEKLAAARLLTVDDEAVEVAHEALLRSWPRLIGWIDEDREMLQTRRRIGSAAAEWHGQDRNPDLLYRGTQLAGALEWSDANPHELTPVGRDFLDAARTLRDDAERRATAAEVRGRRNRRFAVSALAVLTAAAVTASIFAFVALGRSRENEREAQSRQVQALAAAAEGRSADDPLLATALAMESIVRADPPTAAARDALVDARVGLDATRDRPQRFGIPVPVGDMLSVAITADGDRFVTGGRSGEVVFWDRATRAELQRFDAVHNRGVTGLEISDDGRWLLSVGGRRAVLWDLSAEAPAPLTLQEVPAADEPIWAGSFSPDSTEVALATEGAGLLIVDRAGRTINATSADSAPADARELFDLLSVRYLSDDRIVAGNGVGELHLLDGEAALVGLGTIDAHSGDDIWELIRAPGSASTTAEVYSVSTDNTVRAWTTESGNLTETTALDPTLARMPRALLVTDSGLLLGDGDGRLHRVDPETLEPIDGGPSPAHDDRVISGGTSGSGEWLVTLGDDQRVQVWRRVSAMAPVNEALTEVDPARDLAVDADGRILAVATETGVAIVDALTGATALDLATGPAESVAFVDGETVAVGTSDGLVQLWSTTGGSMWAEGSEHNGQPVRNLAVSADGDQLASGAGDGSVRLWSIDDGLTSPVALDGHGGAVTGTAFTPDGDRLISIGFDGLLLQWAVDGATGPIERIELDQDGPQALAVHPDGRLVAVGGAFERIDILDILDAGSAPDGVAIGSMAPHPGGVWDLAFTPDGLSVVGTSRAAGSVQIWDWATGVRLGDEFASHGDPTLDDRDRPEPDLVIGPGGVIWSTALDGVVRRLDVLDPAMACQLGAEVFSGTMRERFLSGDDSAGCRG